MTGSSPSTPRSRRSWSSSTSSTATPRRDAAARRFATATAASLLFPFAPHLGAEVYELLTGRRVWEEPWPDADPAMLLADTFELVCQVNGKVRDRVQRAERAPRARSSSSCASTHAVSSAHVDGHEIVEGDRRARQARQRRRPLSRMVRHVAVVGPGEASRRGARRRRDGRAALAQAGAIVVMRRARRRDGGGLRGAAERGGDGVGILPGADRRDANEWVTVAIPTGLGELRNGLIVRAADAVIAVGGAYGTLSEVALALQDGRAGGRPRTPGRSTGIEAGGARAEEAVERAT